MNILKSGAAQVFFSIVIVSLNNTGKTSGPLKVEWKRSSDSGKTKEILAEKDVVTWNEKIEFKSNLFKDHDELAKKQIFFHVKEKDGKKSRSHGKVAINLSDYVTLTSVDFTTTKYVDVPLMANYSKSPILKVEVHSTILKLKKGDKKLVKNSSGDWEEQPDSEMSWNTSAQESGSDPESSFSASLDRSESSKDEGKLTKKDKKKNRLSRAFSKSDKSKEEKSESDSKHEKDKHDKDKKGIIRRASTSSLLGSSSSSKKKGGTSPRDRDSTSVSTSGKCGNSEDELSKSEGTRVTSTNSTSPFAETPVIPSSNSGGVVIGESGIAWPKRRDKSQSTASTASLTSSQDFSTDLLATTTDNFTFGERENVKPLERSISKKSSSHSRRSLSHRSSAQLSKPDVDNLKKEVLEEEENIKKALAKLTANESESEMDNPIDVFSKKSMELAEKEKIAREKAAAAEKLRKEEEALKREREEKARKEKEAAELALKKKQQEKEKAEKIAREKQQREEELRKRKLDIEKEKRRQEEREKEQKKIQEKLQKQAPKKKDDSDDDTSSGEYETDSDEDDSDSEDGTGANSDDSDDSEEAKEAGEAAADDACRCIIS